MKVNWEIVKIRGFIKEYFDEYAEVDRCEKDSYEIHYVKGSWSTQPTSGYIRIY